MKKLICFLFALAAFVCFLCGAAFADGGISYGFHHKYEYRNGLSIDISEGYSYGKYAARVFALGLAPGEGAENFGFDGKVTVAEAISIASSVHSFCYGSEIEVPAGESWYKGYVDYALENGIISTDVWHYSDAATRRQFATMLYAAMPKSALNTISDVPDGCIPDVMPSDPSKDAIYSLYRAGILTGADAEGSFYPDEDISSAAVSTVIKRLGLRNMRVQFSLNPYKGPDTPVQPMAGEDFFADACIIGNSLVEGIRLYSGLKSMTYYSYTGMTVISAMSGRDFMLSPGYYGSAVDAVSSRDYSKVYIELGVNEIGFPVETFTDYYGEIIERVKSAQPKADVYILSLTPVSRYKDSQGIFTMERINAYNVGLRELAEEMEVYFIDCVTPLVDETGFVPGHETWDGVHFNIPKYAQWEQVIRTRYVD